MNSPVKVKGDGLVVGRSTRDETVETLLMPTRNVAIWESEHHECDDPV